MPLLTCKDCVEYNHELNWCEVIHKTIPLDWDICKKFKLLGKDLK